jgi:hypothetical protein
MPSIAVPVERTLAAALSTGPGLRDLEAPPPPAELPARMRAMPVEVASPLALLPSMPAVQPASIALLDDAANHHGGDGFFSSAFRKTGAVASASIAKTGDVIVKGGAVAGASIMDVFRGLAGAVKKVSPFVP